MFDYLLEKNVCTDERIAEWSEKEPHIKGVLWCAQKGHRFDSAPKITALCLQEMIRSFGRSGTRMDRRDVLSVIEFLHQRNSAELIREWSNLCYEPFLNFLDILSLADLTYLFSLGLGTSNCVDQLLHAIWNSTRHDSLDRLRYLIEEKAAKVELLRQLAQGTTSPKRRDVLLYLQERNICIKETTDSLRHHDVTNNGRKNFLVFS